MHEELPSLIRENLVPRRADQFQFLADLVKTPPESSTADMAAVSDVTTKALKELELGVEQHGVSPDDSSGLSGVTNLVVRHEFAAGPVIALVALRDARPDLSGTVELHITFDGEADGLWGTKWLLDNGIANPDYALGSGCAYGIGTSSVGDLQL